MVGNREEYWVPEDYDGMTAGRYLATRFSSLKPPMLNVPNPIKLLRMLNRQQWSFFAIAFWAWTWDAFDFFTVSLTVGDLAKQFGKTNTDITWGITLVLMFRSVGSIAFGVAADRYGRKWPFIINNLLFIALELVRHTISIICCRFACLRHAAKMRRRCHPSWPRTLGQPTPANGCGTARTVATAGAIGFDRLPDQLRLQRLG